MPRNGTRRADVAVVGLGAIGLPVCLNLVRSGRTVQAWNRSAPAATIAAEAGAEVVTSVADVDAPVVLVALPDMPQIDEALDAGLRGALQRDDLLVVLSTVAPAAVRSLSQRLHRAGVGVVDAPVSGGDVGAQEATLAIMVGASDDDFVRCKTLLDVIGGYVVHLGPVGAGATTKMANQVVVGATLAAIGEALTLTRSAGLPDGAVLDLLSAGLAGSRALAVKRSKLETGHFQPGGSARNQLKDLEHALTTASDLGAELEVTRAVTTLYRRLEDRGLGSLDHSAVVLACMKVEPKEHTPC